MPRILVVWIDAHNSPDADGSWPNAPIFKFNDGNVKFNSKDVSNANDNYGSTSGFLPKSPIIS